MYVSLLSLPPKLRHNHENIFLISEKIKEFHFITNFFIPVLPDRFCRALPSVCVSVVPERRPKFGSALGKSPAQKLWMRFRLAIYVSAAFTNRGSGGGVSTLNI